MSRYRRVAPEGEPHLYLEGDQPTIYRKRNIHWSAVIKWGALALAAVLMALFVLGYAWLRSKESQMRLTGVAEALDKKQKGQPVTTLVMGVDRGSVEGETGPGRTDILMLVSVYPDGKAAVISIPRDTRVSIPEEGYNKINAAHALGGPELAIETVSDFTGLPINHFVEIDFEGFKHIVDAIGGVPMHIDKAINDKYAGKVPAGDVVLTGDQALALVRARHDKNAVPAGDLDRVKNQRNFLQAMLQTVSRQRNPFKVKKLVDAAASNIKTDLTFAEMLLLGRKLQGSGKDGLQMATAPGEPKVIDGTWYYIVDDQQFQELLSAFESSTSDTGETEGKPGKPEKSGITVKVLNGTGVAGLAATVSKELEQKGYQVVSSANANSSYRRTTLYFPDGGNSDAELVTADLEGSTEPLMKSNDELPEEYGVDVLVVLGSNYEAP